MNGGSVRVSEIAKDFSEIAKDFYRDDESRLWPLFPSAPWWAVSEFLHDELSIEEVIRASIAIDTTRMMDNLLFGKER